MVVPPLPTSEPTPRRAQIVTAVLYLIILAVVALVSARAAAYDQQIANLRQQIGQLENDLETEVSRLDSQNLQIQRQFQEMSDRVARLEGREGE